MITARFVGGEFCINVFGLVQWDVGQHLKIEGLDLADGSEVHFYNANTPHAIRKPILEGGICEIPDALLEEGLDIIAWVYNADESINEILLPIEKRKKPDGFVTDKEAKAELEATVQEVNEANAIGKEHLKTLHCIELDENATTSDIMQSIAQIPPLQYTKSISGLMKGDANNVIWDSNIIVLPENTEFTFNLPQCENFEQAFTYVANLTKVTFRNLPTHRVFRMLQAFWHCDELEEVDFGYGFDTEENIFSVLSFNNAFSNCGKLKRIIAVFECYDVEDRTISLIGCDELEEIRFVEYSIVKRTSFRDSPKLSVESIDSIINGLETVDEQTKLTLHSDVVEKLTDEQWQVIYDKNWTVG